MAGPVSEAADLRAWRRVIRPATPGDFVAVGDVTERAFASGRYGHLPRSAERRRLERDVADRVAAGTVLLAEFDGVVAGTVTVLRAGTPFARLARDGEAEVGLMAVAAEAQGSGLGGALLAAAHEVALEWGSSALVLDTGSLDAAAQRLYEGYGFHRVPDGAGEGAADAEGVESDIRQVVYWLDLEPDDDIVVRLARPEEYDAVAALSLRAYALDYELSDEYRASIHAVAERAAEHQVWVAADGATGALLGTVATPRPGRAISPLAEPGELDFRLLAVDPRARGRGVGSRLTRHAIELARLRGLERVVMNSGPQMVGAHRLYEKLGFARLWERERLIVDGDRTFRLLAFTIDVPASPRGTPSEGLTACSEASDFVIRRRLGAVRMASEDRG